MNTRRLARLLWLVAALSAVGLGFVLVLPVRLEALAGLDPKPISVPAGIDDTPAVLPERYVDIPLWNPFDPKGEPWPLVREKPVAEKKPEAAPRQQVQVDGVNGILRLPGLEGVITDEGFIEVGELFSGAEVRRVGDGEAVLSISGKGELLIRVDPKRDERRAALRAAGMPFFGAERERLSER